MLGVITFTVGGWRGKMDGWVNRLVEFQRIKRQKNRLSTSTIKILNTKK